MTEIFANPSFDDHEQVLFVSDPSCGLRGVIAIHNTALGPAAGGCRMYPYPSEEDALKDVLRLSRGMTLKNAAAGLPLGGGKCVIIADPASPEKPDRLRAMARHIQRLGGSYWTAIDVGVGPEDADVMAEASDYVFARASEFADDDPPAHYTALGGFQGIRAVAAHVRGTDDMTGLTVAVQGVGQTGADLIAQLCAVGAEVVAADVNGAALDKVAAAFGVRVAPPEDIHKEHVDVFAPCALGGVLNDETIPELNCKGIAGLANNQLERPEHAEMLQKRGVAYAPDFVVNAGGVMRATLPIFATHDRDLALIKINGVYDAVREILRRADAERTPTEAIAEAIALERVRAAATS
ncbi:MAG: Glu/Leu/Phe/Val dehydrogenase dimerization domain-containing protein [Pseudomonadota bacterium]